jgi:glutathionyl-hydroquinone reductase
MADDVIHSSYVEVRRFLYKTQRMLQDLADRQAVWQRELQEVLQKLEEVNQRLEQARKA